MAEIFRRELIYLWYYFTLQFEQIAGYYILGICLGSVISVFGKTKIHALLTTIQGKKPGILGLVPASLIGIASPLCMYGTIPIAASFSEKGMSMGSATAFMISGPATKITNLGAVKIVLGVKHFVLYLVFVMLAALISGFIVDYVLQVGRNP
jgi:uncharacterized membrane protein YraQ (UPF0718 family)